MTTPNTDALLPCPFCGYTHIQVLGRSMAADMCPDGTPENERMLWRVVCGNCGADHDCHDKKDWAIEAWNTRTAQPSVTSEEWRPATTDTNPLADGDYLTIYRRSEWADGHYVYKVCRFALGNNCTGHIWDATVGEQLWNVKFWMPLPCHPLTAFHVTKKE